MDFKEYLKKCLMTYFIVVTAVTVAIPVLGMNFDPEATFGYEVLFSPLLFGAVALLPSFVLYSRRELTFKRMLLRRVLHFITLELTLLLFGFLFRLFDGIEVIISFAFSVFAVYLFTFIAEWVIDNKTAGEINKGLKKLQS